jgi:hypothetical protein
MRQGVDKVWTDKTYWKSYINLKITTRQKSVPSYVFETWEPALTIQKSLARMQYGIAQTT